MERRLQSGALNGNKGAEKMEDVERKALALVDAVQKEYPDISEGAAEHLAVLSILRVCKDKPDPLVEVLEGLKDAIHETVMANAKAIRAALDALGFEIREKNDD